MSTRTRRLSTLRSAFRPRARSAAASAEGVARVDARTKDLVRRLHPGNVAVIDHADLDRVAAESLIEHGVGAVINAGRSITGRYPNLGPLMLVRAGIPLIDDAGPDVLERVREGDLLTLEGNTVLRDGEVVVKGTLLDEETVTREMDAARERLSGTLEAFAENTLEYVLREQHILVEGVRLPKLQTPVRGRVALVVVRGYHYKEDLHALKGFVREMRPVVIAVDGAADACLAEGIRPDIIVGDVDSVSASALKCGAEILVHPQGDWRRRFEEGEASEEPPEVETIRSLGLDCQVVTAPGMSEDVALLLAHEQGAELVVAVGAHSSAIEMLDKGRRGMASTFLVRMRLGPNLVDAKGLSRLYRTRVRTRDLMLLVASALLSMVIVSFVVPTMRLFWEGVWDQIAQLVRSIL